MANDGFVQVPPNSTGGKVDCSSLSVGGAIVARQRVVIGDPSKSAGLALVSAGSLQVVNTAGTAHIGQVSVTGSVAISNTVTVQGQVSVTGSVAISNTLNMNAVAISGTALASITNTVTVQGQVSAVVTGTVAISNNLNISAMPAVVLGAGTAEIGSIKGISSTVNVAVTNHITIDAISATVNVAGTFTIGTIDKISATATVVGSGFFDSSAGSTTTVRVGDSANSAIRVNVVAGSGSGPTVISITGTATFVVGGFLDPSGQQRNVVDSVNTALRVNVVAGGAGGGIVFGANADGVSATAAAVLVGGHDSAGAGGGVVRTFLTDTSGRQIVNVNGGVAISGTALISGVITNTVTVQGQVTAVVTGTVALAAGAAHIGEVNISTMPAVVIAAGAAHIGEVNISTMPHVTVDIISATATVINSGFFDSSAGSTTLVRVGDSANSAVRCNVVAGNLSISGTLDAISATVNVAITNHITIDNISATVMVSGSFTTGSIVNSASITAGTTLTLVGGSDGLISHILGTDTQGRLIMAGVLNSASVTVGSQIYMMGGCDGTLARTIATDSGGKIRINDISATVMVAGSFTVGGGQVGGQTVSAANVFTLIGGSDGSLGRIIATDTSGRLIVNITGTVALASLNGLGKIDGISAAVSIASLNGLGKIDGISAAVVLAAGAAHIGEVNISVFPALVAGTAHIGEVNISTMPAVVLAAGAAHIGEVNISIMPQVVLAAGTANIGAVSLGSQVAAGTSVTAASVVVLSGGTSRVSAGITGSAAVSWLDPNGRGVVVMNHPSIVASATQGPQNKDITATAFATLVASAGASFVYVTGILVTNGSASVTGVAFASSDQTAAPQVVAYLAANGGGFNKEFNPPWKLSTGTALQGRIFPTAALTVTSVISFYVGP